MNVLGISGTPRAGGNSELLLKYALKPFQEDSWSITEFLLSQHTVAPCDGCDSCSETNRCIKRDGMDALYEAYTECDAIIIASPVYYRNVSAQLKAVFDRSYATRNTKPLENKLGGAIAVGRGTGGGQAITLSIIYNFFLSSGTLCVPGELNGVSAVADEPGDVKSQPKRLKQSRVLGENIVRFSKLKFVS